MGRIAKGQLQGQEWLRKGEKVFTRIIAEEAPFFTYEQLASKLYGAFSMMLEYLPFFLDEFEGLIERSQKMLDRYRNQASIACPLLDELGTRKGA